MGAGAVAAGGIISLCQALPLILSSIVGGLRDLRKPWCGFRFRTDRPGPTAVAGFARRDRVDRRDRLHDLDSHLHGGTDRRSGHDFGLRFPVCHGLLAAHGRDRLVVEPDFGHDGRYPSLDLPGFCAGRMERPGVSSCGTFDRRRGLHRRQQRRHDIAGLEDWIFDRCHPQQAASRDPDRCPDLGGGDRLCFADPQQ